MIFYNPYVHSGLNENAIRFYNPIILSPFQDFDKLISISYNPYVHSGLKKETCYC